MSAVGVVNDFTLFVTAHTESKQIFILTKQAESAPIRRDDASNS